MVLAAVMLLASGCVNPPNPVNGTNATNVTNVTNVTNNTGTAGLMGSENNVIYLLYDPVNMDPSMISEFKKTVTAAAGLVGLKTDFRCTDLSLLVQGTASQASTTCTTTDGASKFEDTSAFLTGNKDKITSLVFVYSNGVLPVNYSPVSKQLAHGICDAITSGKPDKCSSLPEVSKINALLVDNTSYDYSQLGSQLASIGIPLNVKTSTDAGKDIQTYSLMYMPAIVVDSSSVTDSEQKTLFENLVSAGQLEKHGNSYVLYPPATNQAYVGATKDSVKLDVYVMAFCPYGVMMEDAAIPVKKDLGDRLDLNIHFIASGDGTTFNSLHGAMEAAEDMRQLCVKKHYPDKYFDYVSCVDKNYNDYYAANQKTCVSTGCDYQGCEAAQNISNDTIDTCMTGDEGKQLMTADIAIGAGLGVSGSPTSYLDGKDVSKTLPRSVDQLKAAICLYLNDKTGCEASGNSTGTPAATAGPSCG